MANNLQARLGEYGRNDQGKLIKIISDPRVCAVSGKPIIPGDGRVNIEGTNYFYRLKAALVPKQTPESHENIVQQLFEASGLAYYPLEVRRGEVEPE